MTNMTEQTVPVPIDLLQKIKERYPVATAEFDYLTDLVALIPDPPKVGDALNEEQIKALPPRSVLRDDADDLWVMANDGQLHLITFKRDGSLTDDDQEAYDAAEYQPVLVSLPSANRD